MEEQSVIDIDTVDLQTFQNYLSNFWMFLQLQQQQLSSILTQDINQSNIHTFVNNSTNKFMILRKYDKSHIQVELEWTQDMLKSCNILLIKKNNFNIFKDITQFKLSEMIQVVNLDFEGETDPLNISFQYINKLLIPMLGLYRNQFESKSTSDKNTFNNIMRKVNQLNFSMAQCQKMYSIPQIKVEFSLSLKQIFKKNEIKSYLNDEKVLSNQELLQMSQDVIKWNRDIQGLTKIHFDLINSTTLQEQIFWNCYVSSLRDLEMKIDTEEVKFYISMLKKKNKIHITTNFDIAYANMKKMTEKALDINGFFKELKIQELLAAQNLDELNVSLALILQHLTKITTKNYSSKRTYELIEVLSKDLTLLILKILQQQDLMFCSFIHFSVWYDKCQIIFKEVQKCKQKIPNLLKNNSSGNKMNRTSFNQLKINFYYQPLKLRLQQIYQIRKLYKDLKSVIQNIVMKSSANSFLSTITIDEGYSHFKGIDILDTSKEGQQIIDKVKKYFYQCIDEAEDHITKNLKNQLAQSSNPSQMFRIFSKFNELLNRPRIKKAIQEVQSQLLQTVKDGVNLLDIKFKKTYLGTQNMKVCMVRDIPQKLGMIIWANQIRDKLEKYRDRMQQIFASDCYDHPQGKQCKNKIDTLLLKLNTKEIILQWDKETIRILNSAITELGKQTLFKVIKRVQYEATVNFQSKFLQIAKQSINFSAIKPQKCSIIMKAKKIIQFYPFVLSLQQSLQTYYQISSKIDIPIMKLLAQNKNLAIEEIDQGFKKYWKQQDTQVKNYAKKLSDTVLVLQETENYVSEKYQVIISTIQSIATCPLYKDILEEKLNNIQEIIYQFNSKKISNLHVWIPQLNSQLEKIFIVRIQQLIKQWTKQFTEFQEDQNNSKIQKYVIESTKHELKSESNVFFLDPPLEHAKFCWLQEFHRIIGIICSLSRIRLEKQSKNEQNYQQIIILISKQLLQDAYERIFQIFRKAEQFLKIWFSYESLWVIEPKKIYQKLGNSVGKWQTLLNQIRENRKIFDKNIAQKAFGPIIIDYRLVLNKINVKHDSWHAQLLGYFSNNFGNTMKNFHTNVMNARNKLENIDFKNPTADIVEMINDFQQIKKKYDEWFKQVDTFQASNSLLEHQKFKYPSDWLQIDKVMIQWSNLRQIFQRKGNHLEAEIPKLQEKVINDEAILNQNIVEIQSMWNREKPNKGINMLPKQALNVLDMLKNRINSVQENYSKCCQAKELLGLQSGDTQKIDNMKEDIELLQEVWSHLNGIWQPYEIMGDTLITAMTRAKVKEIQNEVVKQLNKTPTKLKSNEPFESMKQKVGIPGGSYYQMNKKIMELKQECMKPRHWKKLLSKLKIDVPPSELKFGKLWNVDLNRNDSIFREVMANATGEMVLQRMLMNVKERWIPHQFDLVRYQGKCNLIKGWDEMFQELDQDLNNLSSMKLSQYYKTFEEQIAQWDDKLQKVRITLDIWIDVQRKWVYLESIFLGSSDIKEMLINEYTRFKGIDTEFTSLMKKVSAKPNIIEVMNMQGLQKNLERLSDMLANIQKALGDYLQTQRAAFARFYFVGDEDLLEIIGNSKDVAVVQRHFTKMYAGITSLQNEKVQGNDLIMRMLSRQGQIVNFKKNVNITQDSKINIWLSKVDQQMQMSLASYLQGVMNEITQLDKSQKDTSSNLLKIIENNPAQVVLLGLQTLWSKKVDDALIQGGGQKLQQVQLYIVNFLSVLASNVVADLKKDLRQKFEQAITDFVHQRDVVRKLLKNEINSNKMFAWLYFMRMVYFPKQQDTLKKLSIQMANSQFHYGFEYLGVGQKLVQTPLTDRCFLTLTQALHLRMGGAPFGPAGTGKTQSVKALGSQLGYFVLVFNCDETFDFHAMGRIFIGLCQVGAWGCFDQFNRLEQRMLSACSQQILVIQTGLRERQSKIQLMGKQVKLSPQVGCFVTMNPGYAGRSNLPQNLKQLFRQMAMVKPDRQLIAQVMLYSQGYKTAQQLAGKIVSLFELCNDQLSSQPHYDFGLRALKSVLVSAGNMKREQLMQFKKQQKDINSIVGRELQQFQQKILLRSVCQTVVPKLIADDIPLLSNLLGGVFPGSAIPKIQETTLRQNIIKVSKKMLLQVEQSFIQKVLQLYQIQRLHHGLMMVGPSGCAKSKAWQVLINALELTDKIKGQSYVIDPKAISKDELYGKLDSTTLQWTDGVFTGVLRKITENQRGQSNRRHWIIFDGDVDPEWAENLNSVLDDNKLLTLSNGERIQIPPNVRIMFEVQTLKYATLATVSRCGMVWFSEEVVSCRMIFSHYLHRLKQQDYDFIPKINQNEKKEEKNDSIDPLTILREQCVRCISFLFEGDNSPAERILSFASTMVHVMQFTIIRVIQASMALVRKGINNIIEYNDSHGISMEDDVLVKYIKKWTVQSFMWGIGGSSTLAVRGQFSKVIADIIPSHQIPMPLMLGKTQSGSGTPYILIDFQVNIEDGDWSLWKKKVPTIEIDPQKVTDADVIIPTVDTLRHQEILCSWLSEHRPFVLCGPPGSGKTMTLMSTLKALPEFEMIFVNFSSSTHSSLIMKQFQHYCEYVKTISGIILRPRQPSKWLVVFCDEINLPDTDKYGTMTVITFLRQLTEQHGFWRTTDRQWISLQRIQFVGACNPPTDIGRKPLNPRFLRHCPLILVDFPGFDSLKQIFGTFNKAMLKKSLSLKGHAEFLTNAMVQFYTESQQHFTSDNQPHYIYSPRQLTRWKYAINQAIDTIDTLQQLIRLWAHEGLRLFDDRLVFEEEKKWCNNLIDDVAYRNFPSIEKTCLDRPILFSNYLTKNYISVDKTQLKHYIEARLKIFYEQQLNVPIVVFDEVLEHILRIDRVLRQPLGHLLLVGASGVGKTTLSRFVSWMNNISVFQIKAGRNYNLHDFDEDLRSVMKRAGVKLQRICFIFDESNCLSPAFLEKMNALLASGEIPGLFEGQEYMLLLTQFKQANSKGVSSDEQIYRNFIKNVQRNLHVVFTMNPNNPDFSNRTASSPALFNRCVIDWFGDWSEAGLYQVAKEFTLLIDPVLESFETPIEADSDRHQIVVKTIVSIHNTVIELNRRLAKSAKKYNFITPRDFLDFIKHFVEVYQEKKSFLQDQQFHLNVGLNKLKQTQVQVIEMQGTLDVKKKQLQNKQKQASSKMTLIVSEKTKVKEKQEESEKLKLIMEAKRQQIAEKKVVVEGDLAKAEPALIAARKNVENINKSDLDTIKNYGKPPVKVQLAMKPIFYMLTKQIKSKAKEVQWAEIRSYMMKDFIKQVKELKADDIPQKVKNYVLEHYIRSPEWDIAAISKASGAAGALAGWAQSQLSYADILTKVDPMRKLINKLEEEGINLENQVIELANIIDQLEQKTKRLEQQYENLIKQKQQIVTDMAQVEDKVNRSKNLLNNLSSEKDRWENTSNSFKTQLASMLGDVFLSGAFLAYIGFFDHYYRRLLMGVWRNHLSTTKIKFRQQISLMEFLSLPSQRLLWKSHKLPSDDLCTENAIIMKRYHKYPLIIDPSGQAIEYLTSLMSEKSAIISSFADEAFLKHLEKSLRFGRPIIVQDVQKVEPILNSVLNKQIFKNGGMTLIRVGDQQIDFNPNFTMFMITRNSNAKFTPDLCSRVTFVNFTVTSSSLEDQCLNIFLKNERPDVEEKRLSLMKMQGEYIVKLRQLEDSLLDALNNVQGPILESESVISTLEKLKTQASKITEEMAKSDDIMREVETVTNGYKNIAEAASKIYFALESMSSLYYLYEYSLTFFMDTIMRLLDSDQNLNKINKQEYDHRKIAIYNALFEKIFIRVANSLLSKDLIIFCLKLVSIKLPQNMRSLFMLLIKPSTLIHCKLSKQILGGVLTEQQLKQIQQLQQHQYFSNLSNTIQKDQNEWLQFISSSQPQQKVPIIKCQTTDLGHQLITLILIKVFRPDKFNPAAYHLVKTVLGSQCSEDYTIDLKSTIASCKSKQPILLSSAPGFDPSFKIEQISKQSSVKLQSVAIGSAEGFEIADKAMKEGVKTGNWVMLKNVHLAPGWLSELQKKIHVLSNPHQNFRLFLTAEFSPKIPSTLIRQSYKLVFQPAAGIKASLIRTYKNVLSPSRSDRLPVQRSRLHFLLGWLHAVILERLRYTPVGWTKVYEFNEADQRCALDLIDQYIDSFGTRNNIDIQKIPWDAFKTILIENLYGGKVDNEYDSKILVSLVELFFTPKSFDSTYPLYSSSQKQQNILKMPDGIKYSQFFTWVEKLPDSESPAWSGLPLNVEKILKGQASSRAIRELFKIQDVNEEQVTLEKKKQDKGSKQLKWLLQVNEKVKRFLQLLPPSLYKLERTQELMNNPLFRFLERQVTVASKLLNLIVKNSRDVQDMCSGKILATNILRQLCQDLHADVLPKSWVSFTIDNTINLTNYMLDLQNRFEQFNKLIKQPQYQCKGVWFGGLLFPEAYMTATRQFVAQKNGWSLQQLELHTELYKEQDLNQESLLMTGLRIEGANWSEKNCMIPIGDKEEIGKSLPPLLMKWCKVSQKIMNSDEMMVPVYLNRTRKNLIMSLRVKCGNNRTTLYQKGIAIILWTL